VILYLQGRQAARERLALVAQHVSERELLLNRVAHPEIVQHADRVAEPEGPEPYSEYAEFMAVMNGEEKAPYMQDGEGDE
jgi:hypothetical protein